MADYSSVRRDSRDNDTVDDYYPIRQERDGGPVRFFIPNPGINPNTRVDEDKWWRQRRWLWLIPIVCLLVIVPVTTTLLVKRHNAAKSLADSTSNSTSPAAIQGFDIWSFTNGDLMLVYESGGSIWTKQYQEKSWSNATLITSGAKPGTTVRLWAWVPTDYYGYNGIKNWNVIYVDNNSILQERTLTIGAPDFTQAYNVALSNTTGNWKPGILGSKGHQWKVSDTMYFDLCFWRPTDGSTMTGGLYYDNSGGTIGKLGMSSLNDSWWWIDLKPSDLWANNKPITCTSGGGGIETLWLVNEDDLLAQWWLNSSALKTDSNETWTRGFEFLGRISPNTLLVASSTPHNDMIFYQAPNNSIMYFTVAGSSSPNGSYQFSLSSSGFVSNASAGTHLITDPGPFKGPNATFDSFFLYFQNGTDLMRESIVPNTILQSSTQTGLTNATAITSQLGWKVSLLSAGQSLSLSSCGVWMALSYGIMIFLLL